MQLTTNFNLSEFLESDFFGDYQQDVIDSYIENESELFSNIQELALNLQVLRDYIN